MLLARSNPFLALGEVVCVLFVLIVTSVVSSVVARVRPARTVRLRLLKGLGNVAEGRVGLFVVGSLVVCLCEGLGWMSRVAGVVRLLAVLVCLGLFG